MYVRKTTAGTTHGYHRVRTAPHATHCTAVAKANQSTFVSSLAVTLPHQHCYSGNLQVSLFPAITA